MAVNKCAMVLGTVQLGLPYGIANTSGQPDFDTAMAIVRRALELGVHLFDTAQAYGDSESVLGSCLTALQVGKAIGVYSKLDKQGNYSSLGSIESSVRTSLKRLKQERLKGLMLHSYDMLPKLDCQLSEIDTLKTKGLIENFGVSVYSAEEAIRALKHEVVDLVQVPANAWDFSAQDQGVFTLARSLKKTVMVRSVYLQGLLLLGPNEVSQCLPRATSLSQAWHAWLLDQQLEAQDAALGMANQWGDMLVIGAETPDQIYDTRTRLSRVMLTDAQITSWQEILASFDVKGKGIADPREWAA